MNEDDVIGVTGILHLLDDRKFGGLAEVDTSAHFLVVGLQQPVEWAALPGLGGGTLVAAAILANGFFLDTVVAPAENVAFVHGMQRVDEGETTRERQAGRPAFLAELAQEGGVVDPFQATADDPVGDVVDFGVFHCPYVGCKSRK